MTAVSVTVEFEWRLEEPDDNCQCVGCQETIYTAFRRMYLRANGGEWTQSQGPIILCQSCYEVFKEQYDT